VLVQQ